MAEITATMVKELREKTGLPLMDCKKALQETGGDEAVALTRLRESGKKIMATRQDRSTEEGRIAIFSSLQDGVGAMIELQVESAPVAKNEEVIALVNDLARQLATGPGADSPEALWQQPAPSRKGVTLSDWKDELENKIREVFRLARIARIDRPCGGYVHHDGKTGVLVAVEGGEDTLIKQIAMHVAAMKPKALSAKDLDPNLVTKERAVLLEAARQEGKPENILEKMVEGRMRNFYAEHVLEEQPFIHDDKKTVAKVAQEGGMKLIKFLRWQLGETSPPAKET